MASGRIFGSRNLLSSWNTKSINWSVPQRGVSKVNTVLKKMGLPEKPKRPVNAFLQYLSSTRKQLVAQNPNMSLAEISKFAAKQWEKEPEHEKQKYTKDYESRKEVYKAELKKFNELMVDNVKEEMLGLLAEEEMKVSQQAILRRKRHLEKELNKPKHPGAVLTMYYKKYGGNKEGKDILKAWRELPQSKKDAYKAEFSEEVKKYHENLLKWEEEMLQQGNIDVVRLKSIREKFLKCSAGLTQEVLTSKN